jgi:D-aminopeptidase
LFLAFSTAPLGGAAQHGVRQVGMLDNDQLDPFFQSTVHSVEESVINALVAAETMTGINHNTVYRLPVDQVMGLLKKFGRLP